MQPADCGERERMTERREINFRASEKKKQRQWKLIERAELSFSGMGESKCERAARDLITASLVPEVQPPRMGVC